MSIEDKMKAAAKNLEGKAQEAIGDVTGDPQAKAEGKAKQVQAAGMNVISNVKDAANDLLNKVQEQIDR